jgi:hypothetical protein
MSTNAAKVQAVASKGEAAAGNNSSANILVLVTDTQTGSPVASLVQSDFTVIDHFTVTGQVCGFSNNISLFDNVGTGAYHIEVATHSSEPHRGVCKWVSGEYLGQVIVKTTSYEGQAAFTLTIP